jgi:hypothetical protein
MEDWLEGRRSSAKSCWSKCVGISEHTLFGVIAQFQLGRHLEGQERNFHLQKAEKLLQQAGIYTLVPYTRKEMVSKKPILEPKINYYGTRILIVILAIIWIRIMEWETGF